MRSFRWLIPLLVVAGVGPALAQGPMLTAFPANTCPSGKPLKLLWIANEVASDGAFGAGPGFAETLVVCHNTDKSTSTKKIDIWVEFFDSGGLPAGPAASMCDVAPGATAPFVTAGAPPPYIGTLVFAFVAPPGSLRVMATKPKVVCDVTLFDTGGVAAGFAFTPVWSKDVTVTKAKAPQRGD